MTQLEEMFFVKVPVGYGWSDDGIVRIGLKKDIAAYVVGDFMGPCLIFCHGNGETAISERHWFEQFAKCGMTVICPDYRGYGLSAGDFSERGCYDAAHAAYEWFVACKKIPTRRISVLGYSLGSAIAVELAATVNLSSLILQAPFLSGAALRTVWEKKKTLSPSLGPETAFPTEERLSRVNIPTLVIHGTADAVIPVEQGRAVYDKISCSNKELKLIEGAGHCNFQFHIGDRYAGLLAAFLKRFECWGMRHINELIKSGEVNAATEELKKLLVVEPDNAEARMLYGTCCHLLGDDQTFQTIYGEFAPKMEVKKDEKKLSFCLVNGNENGDERVWILPDDQTFIIGRLRSCDLKLRRDNVGVSGRQLTIAYGKNGFSATNIGQSCVSIDGKSLLRGESVCLLPGDQISIGYEAFVVKNTHDLLPEVLRTRYPDFVTKLENCDYVGAAQLFAENNESSGRIESLLRGFCLALAGDITTLKSVVEKVMGENVDDPIEVMLLAKCHTLCLAYGVEPLKKKMNEDAKIIEEPHLYGGVPYEELCRMKERTDVLEKARKTVKVKILILIAMLALMALAWIVGQVL